MQKWILAVGENEPLWGELKEFCEAPSSAWKAEFVQTGLEALGRFAEGKFDAVVSDVQLCDMSGTDLLDDVMRWRPSTKRIILSDVNDTESTVQCMGRGHRHVFKPCDSTTLLKLLTEGTPAEIWKPSDLAYGLITKMRRVPSPPTVYFQIVSEMESAYASVERIGDLIAEDPSLSAKILQLANSAVFGLQLQVVRPVEAVAYLGMETTKALVLLANTFSAFEQLKLGGFSVEAMWRHSVFTGRCARKIMQAEEGTPEQAEQASAAGLLHDLGKLLFAANLPEKFGEALARSKEGQMNLSDAESLVIGASHAEVGGCLLGIWGLPRPVVEAVALHHDYERVRASGFAPATAVTAANILTHEAMPADAGQGSTDLASNPFEALGMAAEAEKWRLKCMASCLERDDD
jgi:HD-like signal output (HDOD) protein/ActR/RegA family two-component response regulator